MQSKIVIVEAKFAQNLGLIARAMKNFGLSELILVKPFADKESVEAISRASHAIEVLKKAKICETIKEAVKGSDYVIATTAKISKNNAINRNSISLHEFLEQFKDSNKNFSFLFGNEERGLTNEQINQADVIVTIPSSYKYPTLNISHAIAIFCYELFQSRKKTSFNEATGKKKKLIEQELFKILENASKIKSQESVRKSVKAFLNRSMLSEKEANAILSLLKAR
ncbi:MAG: RNA methyltransferase [archaeon]|nr:RNA methyltransferase [archaeon]